MSSSSLLPSKYFDKLQVNRLKANDIKSDNIIPTSPSYLFSAVFNNAIFDRNNTGGTLTITKDDTESIIQFSDRPFRKTENINFDSFVSLFSAAGNNSFEEDPPNGVLTHDEEQRTYIITLLNSDTDSAIFSLELLPGETHNLNTISGRMNLFVDNTNTDNTNTDNTNTDIYSTLITQLLDQINNDNKLSRKNKKDMRVFLKNLSKKNNYKYFNQLSRDSKDWFEQKYKNDYNALVQILRKIIGQYIEDNR